MATTLVADTVISTDRLRNEFQEHLAFLNEEEARLAAVVANAQEDLKALVVIKRRTKKVLEVL